MRHFVFSALVLCLLASVACTAQTKTSDGPVLVQGEEARGADVFNPWRNEKLPTSRQLSKDGSSILGAMGGGAQSIQGEAKHRRFWREEIYPIVFGQPGAPHEILVVLDFSNPKSEALWQEVVSASRSLDPKQTKIVVFGKSQELYGTDLMGLLIWLTHERKGQAMPYLSFALQRWNAVKNAQKKSGHVRRFNNEYDSTATTSDYPIHYMYLAQLRPPVMEEQELGIARYSYDAGNVNMYQATQLTGYYGINSLPCVVVDGKVLGQVGKSQILGSLR